MQSRISLICKSIQAFTQDDILKLLPESTLREIKAVDPHPFFQMYSICHEGESTPKILDSEEKPISWGRRAIQSIKNIITKGIKFFSGHNKDNSTKGRRELGEVVHSFEKEIDGKLNHVVIGYYPPETREEVQKYDVCSQEANWNFLEHAGYYIADKIDQLTGIALANSGEEAPAFEGAKRLGMVQAFETKSGEDNNSQATGNNEPGKGDKAMPIANFAEWKQWGIDHNVYPSQMFTEEQIHADRNFSKIFVENEALKKSVTEKDLKIKALEEESKSVKTEYQKSTAKDRLAKIIESNTIPMTDEIKAYIKGVYPEDINSMQDFSDDQLSAYLQKSIREYQRVKAYETKQKTGDKKVTGDQSQQTTQPGDPTKKENNPLLEEDYQPDI